MSSSPKHSNKMILNSKNNKKTQKSKKKQLKNQTRKPGRQIPNKKLLELLKITQNDVKWLLWSHNYYGGSGKPFNHMIKYLYKSGNVKCEYNLINLQKTWHKILLAARILVAYHPSDILAISPDKKSLNAACGLSKYKTKKYIFSFSSKRYF